MSIIPNTATNAARANRAIAVYPAMCAMCYLFILSFNSCHTTGVHLSSAYLAARSYGFRLYEPGYL